MKKYTLFLTVFCFAGSAYCQYSEFLDFQWLNPRPTGMLLTSISCNGPIKVACGNRGTLIYEVSGDWFAAQTPTNVNLTKVEFINGQFFALGEQGTILQSMDGKNWTVSVSGMSSLPLIDIASNGTDIIAISAFEVFTSNSPYDSWATAPFFPGLAMESLNWNGFMYSIVGENLWATSLDGQSWSSGSIGAGPIWLQDHAWDGSQFLATDPTAFQLYTSPDGFTWTSGTTTSDGFFGLDYLGGRWVARGNFGVYSSSDSINWLNPAPHFLLGMSECGGDFFGVGLFGQVVSSTDLAGWADLDFRISDQTLKSVAQKDDLAIGLGENGYLSSPFPMINWMENIGGPSPPAEVICANHELFVAGGNAAIWTTADGVNWTSTSVGTSFIRSIYWTGSLFIALNDDMEIYTSPTGTSWLKEAQLPPATQYEVRYYNQNFYVLHDQKILHSTDLLFWTTLPNMSSVKDMAYNGKTYLVLNGQDIWSSQDGVHFQMVSSFANGLDFFQLEWSQREFVLTGDGLSYFAKEGIYWQEKRTSFGELTFLFALPWMTIGSQLDGSILACSPSLSSSPHNRIGVNLPIPDNQPLGVIDFLNIPDKGFMNAFDVWVEIDHSYLHDLRIELEHVPTGSTYLLLDRPQEGGLHCTRSNLRILFSDLALTQAQTSCQASRPGLQGEMKPLQAISGLERQLIQGDWTIRVSDHSASDTGVLKSWSIIPKEVERAICSGEPITLSSNLSDIFEGNQTVFTWYRDGQLLPFNSDSISFTVTEADEGIYTCVAETACGNRSGTVYDLKVNPAIYLEPKIAVQGLRQIIFLAHLNACGPFDFKWENVNLGTFINYEYNQPGPFEGVQLLGIQESTSTVFRGTIDNGISLDSEESLALIAQDNRFFDLNSDGCNNLLDIFFLAPFWQGNAWDANQDNQTNILDFLYINLDDPLNCP